MKLELLDLIDQNMHLEFCRKIMSYKSHALTALAEKFGIVYNAYNALDDAMTCGKLVQLAAQKFEDVKSIEELLEAAGIEIKSL